MPIRLSAFLNPYGSRNFNHAGGSNPRLVRVLVVLTYLMVFVIPFVKYTWLEVWGYVGGDFQIFYQAATDLSKGLIPYPSGVLEGSFRDTLGQAWGNYIYPPLFARLLWPFTWLPIVWAKRLYVLLGLLGVFAALRCWWLPRRANDKPHVRWDVFTLILLWGPTIHTSRHGQSDFIPLVLIIVAYLFLQKATLNNSTRITNWEFLAGLLVGVGAMIKLTPVLIFPLFLVAQRFRWCLGFALGSLGALILSGPVTSWVFFTRVLPAMSDFTVMRHCPALHLVVINGIDHFIGAVSHSEIPFWLPTAGLVVSGLCYLAILVWGWAERHRPTTELLLVGCFLPPIFAGEVAHHYAPIILPAVVMWGWWWGRYRQGDQHDSRNPQSSNNTSNWWTKYLLIVGLLPDWYYWFPALSILETLPTSQSTNLVVGNGLLLILFLYSLRHFAPQSMDQLAGQAHQGRSVV